LIGSHLQKLRRRHDINSAEEAAIRAAIGEVRRVRADQVVIRAGEPLSECTLLVDGWLARVKDLRSGVRQYTELHVPGDFADLHSFTLKRLEHDVVSLTACTLVTVSHDRVRELTENFPHLARVYWFQTNLDAAIHREWMVCMARRSAMARVAHLLCELWVRLEIVGRVDGTSFDFPLTQSDFAECLGLTSVHVNRTLQELRKRKLISLENRKATILDMEALHELAEFDPVYLYLERQPR
jgi:CRP-like cAMP-binding protein